jgi:hypothetical protein
MVQLNIPKENEDDLLIVNQDDVKPEGEVTVEVNEVSDNDYVNYLEQLQEEGLISIESIPDDIDTDNFNEVEFKKFIKHILKNKDESIALHIENNKEEVFESLLSHMSENTRLLIQQELNGLDGEDIIEFHKSLLYKTELTSLNPKDVSDAEQIIRAYYKHTGLSKEELDDDIDTFKKSGKLEAKATSLKPKLDKIAEDIALTKIEEQNRILEFEDKQKHIANEKLRVVFDKGDVMGIPLDKELADLLFNTLVVGEVEMVIRGKKVVVPADVALFMQHKTKADFETSCAAVILLKDPKTFEKYYQRKVQTKEIDKFVKENKLSNLIKNNNNREKEEVKTSASRAKSYFA